jgi:hypothetical protein
MKRKTSNRLKRKDAVYKHIIANKIFDDCVYNGDLDKTIASIKKYKPVLEKFLFCLKNYHNIHFRHWKKWDKRNGYSDMTDNRRGWETYEYESKEAVEATLRYISDRFAAEFRIQWMIDLIDADFS